MESMTILEHRKDEECNSDVPFVVFSIQISKIVVTKSGNINEKWQKNPTFSNSNLASLYFFGKYDVLSLTNFQI